MKTADASYTQPWYELMIIKNAIPKVGHKSYGESSSVQVSQHLREVYNHTIYSSMSI